MKHLQFFVDRLERMDESPLHRILNGEVLPASEHTMRKYLSKYVDLGYISATTDCTGTVYGPGELPHGTKIYYLSQVNMAKCLEVGVKPTVRYADLFTLVRKLRSAFPEHDLLGVIEEVIHDHRKHVGKLPTP